MCFHFALLLAHLQMKRPEPKAKEKVPFLPPPPREAKRAAPGAAAQPSAAAAPVAAAPSQAAADADDDNANGFSVPSPDAIRCKHDGPSFERCGVAAAAPTDLCNQTSQAHACTLAGPCCR